MRVVYLRLGSREIRVQLYELNQPMRELTEKLAAAPFDSGGVAHVPMQFLSTVLDIEVSASQNAGSVAIRHPKSGEVREFNSVMATAGRAVPARPTASSTARHEKAGAKTSSKGKSTQPVTQRPRDGRWAGTSGAPTGSSAPYPTVSINFIVDKQGTVVKEIWGSIQQWAAPGIGIAGMWRPGGRRGGSFSFREEMPIKQVSFGNRRGPIDGYFTGSRSASGTVVCVDSIGTLSGSWKAEWVGPLPAAAASQPRSTSEAPKVQESAAVQAARKLGTPTDRPVVTTASGLQCMDVRKGAGEAAKVGDTVSVHYIGWLVDGAKFDSSLDRGQPFTFLLGNGSVIRGWDEGVAGMKPGGVRKLIIPANLGYGSRGAPPVIPPDATLIFEVSYLGKG